VDIIDRERRVVVESVNKIKVPQLKEALKNCVIPMDGLKADLRAHLQTRLFDESYSEGSAMLVDA